MRITHFIGSSSLLLAIGFTSSPAVARGAQPTDTEQARVVIDHILAHPDQGAISVHYINGNTRWERHFNADRLNSLASTWKVVSLIAYGQAVANGEIDPTELRPKEDWARFLAGGDGGAFEEAWERLGKPDLVTVDQMVGAMMQESDNAMPDWIFDEVGVPALQKAIDKYFTPPKTAAFHDPPRSINAMFLTWDENPLESQIGNRIATSFSDGGTFGYRGEVGGWFELLRDPSFVEQTRQYRCAFPPWEIVDNCTPPDEADETSEPNLKRLQENFFIRSNTRTYARVMLGLLERDMLPPDVQQAIEHSMEWRLATYGDRFRRYGAKSGGLGTINGFTQMNWTTYVEDKDNAPGSDRGIRTALTIQVRGAGSYIDDPLVFFNGMTKIADALVDDPSFAEEVRARLPVETPLPDLVARVTDLQIKGNGNNRKLRVDLEVFNIGTRAMQQTSEAALYLSQDNVFDAGDAEIGRIRVKNLKPGGHIGGQARATLPQGSPSDWFVITVIDPDGTLVESDEATNVQWERLSD